MDPVSLAIVSMTGLFLIGTYLGYRVGELKGKVDKIMPLLEALEELRENQEKYDEERAKASHTVEVDHGSLEDVVDPPMTEKEWREAADVEEPR